MVGYIGKIIDGIPEYIRGKYVTTTAHHMFDIEEDETKLYQTDAELFHHFLAQTLYQSKRAPQDIYIGKSHSYSL